MRALFLTAAVLLLVTIYVSSCSSAPAKEETLPGEVSTAPVTPRTEPSPAEGKTAPSAVTKSFSPLLKQLPRTEDVRKSGQDFHHAPPQLREGARVLGQVAREMKSRPETVAAGIQFYADCAAREGVLQSLRVVCLRNWREWAKRTGAPAPDDTKFPEEMLNLEKELPASR